MAARLAFAVVLLALIAPGAAAHEKWFVDADAYPLQADGAGLRRVVLALALALLLVGAAALADRIWRGRARPVTPESLAASKADLDRLLSWIPVILGVHAAVPLVAAGAQRYLLAPNLELAWSFGGAAIGLAEIVIALAFLYGMLTRAAAVLLAVLFVVGAVIFGPVELAEQLHFLGIAFFLAIVGRGRYSFDRVLIVPRPGVRRLIPAAIPALRILTGLAIAWVGITEKLLNIPMGAAFLTRYPVNVLRGFGVADEAFVVLAGVIEVAIGLLIASGQLMRLVIAAAWVPFNLTLPLLGWKELTGHLPIYGIMAVLLLWGNARDVRGYVEQMVRD